MILRWMKTDDSGKKLPAIRRRLALRQGEHEVGESEFNAILEEVCDTVMPRKPPKKPVLRHDASAHKQAPNQQPPSRHLANQQGQEIPWSTLFLKLGEETSASLTMALAQLQEIALLHPNVAPAIANVTDRLDHSRRAAMIAQQFTQLRGPRDLLASEVLSLRQVVSDAITRRARWLHRRQVKARLGLLDAEIQCHAASLHTLVEELINWAGGIAQDIGFAVREPSQAHHGAQLLVMARVNTASLEPDHWQNIGWFLWHQLAHGLGARAELQVTQEALSVMVDFAAPSAASGMPSTAAATGGLDSALDTDISSIISGCRALLILSKSPVQEQARRAVSRLGLTVTICTSIAQARDMLHLSQGDEPLPLPHAIVYENRIEPSQMADLRQELQQRYPERKMAFVELSEHVGSDFHVSHMGDASTAHVSVQAIAKSLAPALVFELCKVI